MDIKDLIIPEHVAIIMDGNGRWAKKRKMPRSFGHVKGADVLEQIVEDCDDLGIKYLTVYAFSTENWSRPPEEVKVLMNLFREHFIAAFAKCAKNNVVTRVIGDRSGIADDLLKTITDLEEESKDNTGITFTVAINYGSRDEILRCVRKIADEIKEGKLEPSDIDKAVFEDHLDTRGLPDPDLLIRTSGEERLSNYLMWQLAYTEFYFTDVAWPDFNKGELIKAIEKYSLRDRRYGGVK